MSSPRSLPDEPRLAQVAEALAQTRDAAILCDPQWRLVWVSEELENLIGEHDPDRIGYGKHLFQAYLSEPWIRTVTPESQISGFGSSMAYVMPDTIGGKEGLKQILCEAMEAWTEPPAWAAGVGAPEELLDALFEMLEPEAYGRFMERGTIEVAPLAYMRGRTLNDSFIILDEAQNTTPEQMKMFLTRLGFGSKAVVTGDVTQIDLPNGARSGLVVVEEILEDIAGVEFTRLHARDVVRHKIVQDIVEAYRRFEEARPKGKR